jgi:hypothetical protein
MLTLMHHTTNGLLHPFPTLEALLAEPFPRTPQDMMQLEQQLSTAAAQTADQILLVQVTRAHEDEAFVRQAMVQARAQRAVPLVHKGLRTTSVLLLGGTRLILKTPYLREDRRGAAGPAARQTRGARCRLLPSPRVPRHCRSGQPSQPLGDRPAHGPSRQLSRSRPHAQPARVDL